MTIPNLELEAACLVITVCDLLKDEYPCDTQKMFLWTDAHIVLWWLHKDPDELKVFQANRVRKILSRFPENNWSYVKTDENPVDIASRGALSHILMHKLW